MSAEIVVSGLSITAQELESLPTTKVVIEALVSGHLSPHTRRAYYRDALDFMAWLQPQELTLATLSKHDVIQYRRFLADNFAKATASRKLVVARKLLEEAVNRDLIPRNPAQGVGGYAHTEEQETPHAALSRQQARDLLAAVDTSTRQGKRDYALLSLLLRTGLRRSECAALQLGDLVQTQGYQVAVIRHAKGDKRRQVKLPVEVRQAIDTYIEAIERTDTNQEMPLFVQFRKGDHPQTEGISDQVIKRVVETYAAKVGLKLSPHGLRATFVTLALEGGARLHQVQYAVGHADPRTTEHYQKRKLNLQDNAVDYVRL